MGPGSSDYDEASAPRRIHFDTKNLQSIRETNRFADFLSELVNVSASLLFITETWRSEVEEIYALPEGGTLYLSGGSCSKGVGIFIAPQFRRELSDINFTSFSQRLCTLDFLYYGISFRSICCYVPTAWDEEEAVDEVYDLVNFLLDDCRRHGRRPVLGGDFNASVGALMAADPADAFGSFGMGARSARGCKLCRWVLQHGLTIHSRMGNDGDKANSWTCRRTFDGAQVQIDYIIGDAWLKTLRSWCDDALPVGLDHRVVHSVVGFDGRKRKKHRRPRKLREWVPKADANGEPTDYHNAVLAQLSTTGLQCFADAEKLLHKAALQSGCAPSRRKGFAPSAELSALRMRRRSTQIPTDRRDLSKEVSKTLRAELRTWRTARLQAGLGQTSCWKALRLLRQVPYGKVIAQQPHPNEFATELEELFKGIPTVPEKPDCTNEPDFRLEELQAAVSKMKSKKACDDAGVAAELLRFAPEELLAELLVLYNQTLRDGIVPET